MTLLCGVLELLVASTMPANRSTRELSVQVSAWLCGEALGVSLEIHIWSDCYMFWSCEIPLIGVYYGIESIGEIESLWGV